MKFTVQNLYRVEVTTITLNRRRQTKTVGSFRSRRVARLAARLFVYLAKRKGARSVLFRIAGVDAWVPAKAA